MPVVETQLPGRTPQEDALLKELIAELREPQTSGQPLVEIRQMSRGGVKHVYVIWDKWDSCPPESRSSLVRDAFAVVRGDEFERSIAIAIAATVPEAAELGLLPFEVKPFRWYQLGEPTRRIARQALIAEGASQSGPAGLPSLRYRTEQEAEEAVSRLRERAPSIDWGVVVTVTSPE